MTANIYAKPAGTQVALQLNGADAVVYDATGIVSGVNKSAVSQQATLGTAVPYSSFTTTTYHDFLSIPSWVKKITVMQSGVSLSGSASHLIQIGSGSIDTASYLSGSENVSGGIGSNHVESTTGFVISSAGAAAVVSGHMVLTHMGSNVWVESHTCRVASTNSSYGGGVKTLSGTLDRIRLTTTNGTDTFDAGSINILYE